MPPATTPPASTTEPAGVPRAPAIALLLAAIVSLATACGEAGWWGRGSRRVPNGGLSEAGRQDPALSGDGRVLASVVERAGRETLILQEQPSGRLLALRHLRRQQPHSSPSLSWNARYVAVLVQQGTRRLAVIEDRLSGRLHRLPLPGDQQPERLSLSPDGRRLALQVLSGGRSRLVLFDLATLLEPDLPGGRTVLGGGAVLP